MSVREIEGLKRAHESECDRRCKLANANARARANVCRGQLVEREEERGTMDKAKSVSIRIENSQNERKGMGVHLASARRGELLLPVDDYD